MLSMAVNMCSCVVCDALIRTRYPRNNLCTYNREKTSQINDPNESNRICQLASNATLLSRTLCTRDLLWPQPKPIGFGNQLPSLPLPHLSILMYPISFSSISVSFFYERLPTLSNRKKVSDLGSTWRVQFG